MFDIYDMSVSETEKQWIPFLQDAMFAGKPICILPACVMKIPIETDEDIDESQVLSDILVSKPSYSFILLQFKATNCFSWRERWWPCLLIWWVSLCLFVQSKSQGRQKLAVKRTMQRMASSQGLELMLKKGRDELEENLKLSAEKGRRVGMEQTRAAISAVEQAAVRMGSAIINNNFISNVLDKASHLGNRK